MILKEIQSIGDDPNTYVKRKGDGYIHNEKATTTKGWIFATRNKNRLDKENK
jgi:hypothetical protein